MSTTNDMDDASALEHVRVTFAAAPIPLVGVYTPRPCSVDGCAGVACVAVEDTWYCPPHAEGPLNRWFDRPSRETA